MMNVNVIKGGSHTDFRGTISFFNDFDMRQVKRFYCIIHPDTETKRGWRGHKIEQRWFYVTEGSFEIELVSINDWDRPDHNLPIVSMILDAERDEILHVPVGYATCIRALKAHSKVILFADYDIKNAKLDDHVWPLDYFNKQQ